MTTWKDRLADTMGPDLAREIDIFETQIELRRQDKLEEKVFAETRLRKGVYGQRYDNGQRHDGIDVQQLDYRSEYPTKGVETVWDAPGMQRIKMPFGGLNPDQMDVLADLAEEYSDGICHVTTRQDIQLHFVHLEDTPSLMRRLAAVGVTTHEACGNAVRNVTACPLSGACHDEVFDVTPYARAAAQYMLGHPDFQDFGRKFKVSFSGCASHPCALATIHDMGLIAAIRTANGKESRGFTLYVGGGLGAVPYQAKLVAEFLPVEELLPTAQAIGRVFGRLGEKKNRARARIKFLVDKLGLEEFRRLVREERKVLPEDPRWTSYLAGVSSDRERPLQAPVSRNGSHIPEGYDLWRKTNVYRQKQDGFVIATVALPLGDLSSYQLRNLAAIARRLVGDHARTTEDQNIVLRWVREEDLPELYTSLQAIGLAQPGAGTIVDITACPGTDTCKLGIASSRGLAEELRTNLASQFLQLDEAVKNLRIKVSGCFNSCGQHHVADIGFYGVSRTIDHHKVPHFRVVLGGQWAENAGSYGQAIGAVPSKRIPEVVRRITDRYIRQRQGEEKFQDFIQRIGKKVLREDLEDLMVVPSYEKDPTLYSDWGDPREFTMSDIGTGECAGEVVTPLQFGLTAAERELFEAQIQLDEGDFPKAWHLGRGAMLQAAKTLVREQFRDVPDEPEAIVSEFKKRFFDTKIFFDKYAGGKFGNYLFRPYEQEAEDFTDDTARKIIAEAQLFIEASHACYARLEPEQVAPMTQLSRLSRSTLRKPGGAQ